MSFCNKLFVVDEINRISAYRKEISQGKTISLDGQKQYHEEAFNKEISEKIYKQLNQINEEATATFVWLTLIRAYKPEIITCFILRQSEILLKIAIAFAIGQIFETFPKQDKTECYLYVMMMGIIWLIIGILDQNAWRTSEIISIKAKGSVIYALYRKILTLTNFNIGGKERGEVINSVVEFHDILENNLSYLFTCISAPLGLIGFGGLLVWKIGWIALVGVFIPSFFEILHYHYANQNSGIYEQIAIKKDERVRTLSEVIAAFRYIKTQGWSSFFIDKIKRQREKQKSGFISYGFGRSLEIAMSEGIATVYILIVMYSASVINEQLNSTAILQGVLVFLMLKLMIIFTSYGVSSYYMISVIFSRIVSIFKIKQIKMQKITGKVQKQISSLKLSFSEIKIFCNEQNMPAQNFNKSAERNKNSETNANILQFSNFYGSYSSDLKENNVLKGVNISIKKGQFIGVYGKVGSGKSSLLYSMAKMMPYYSGQVSIAALSSLQQSEPALFSGSIEDNVLFSLKKDEILYSKALRFSCLDQDITNMALGDQTLVEEGALNLSGGQRTRICLARIIYADRPILLLDDPLSSLDLRVIHKVVENLSILSKSEGKTIILATHHVNSLAVCDRCIEVSLGRTNIMTIAQFLQNRQKNLAHQEEDSQESQNQLQAYLAIRKKSISEMISQSANQNKSQSLHIQKPIQTIISAPKVQQAKQTITHNGFISTFISYLFENKKNYFFFPLMLLSYIASEGLYATFVLYLDEYDAVKQGHSSSFKSLYHFWTTLMIISAATVFCQIFRTFFLNLCLQHANQSLHNQALEHIFKAQVLGLDKMGTKNILDKFSSDLGVLDAGTLSLLSLQFIVGTICVIQVIVISIINLVILPFSFILLIALLLWYLYCNSTVIELKAADMEKNGPTMQHFSESLNGLAQIRNFNIEQHMNKILEEKLSKSIAASYQSKMINRAFGCLCLYITSAVIVGSYFGLVAFISDVKNFMFAAVFLIDINECSNILSFNTTKLNSSLVSYKRIKTLLSLILEKQSVVKSKEQEKIIPFLKNQSFAELKQNKKQNIPAISLIKLSLSYGDTLALKSISIEAKTGQKIALIGRTGSGKSSVVQGLLRLVEPSAESQYLINGENALNMDVNELRKQFACIPQTPFLFNDTLRRNLDPFGKFSDAQIEEALRKTCILDYVRQNFSSGLDTDMCSAGSALSTGQKQLICFARVVLKPKKFLILDEATANIDHKTDEIIQAIIRSEFAGVTVISVAHRLSTIIDYDKIIVLSHGQIVEQGNAADLWKRRGEFYSMIMSNPHESKAISKKIQQTSK